MSENNTVELMVVVPNPDNLFLPPIYTGKPQEIAKSLIPGRYKVIVEDWNTDRQYDGQVTILNNGEVVLAVTFPAGE